MKIWTLDEILNTEHLGDEKYVRLEELERVKLKVENEISENNRLVIDQRRAIKELNEANVEIERLGKLIKKSYCEGWSANNRANDGELMIDYWTVFEKGMHQVKEGK